MHGVKRHARCENTPERASAPRKSHRMRHSPILPKRSNAQAKSQQAKRRENCDDDIVERNKAGYRSELVSDIAQPDALQHHAGDVGNRREKRRGKKNPRETEERPPGRKRGVEWRRSAWLFRRLLRNRKAQAREGKKRPARQRIKHQIQWNERSVPGNNRRGGIRECDEEDKNRPRTAQQRKPCALQCNAWFSSKRIQPVNARQRRKTAAAATSLESGETPTRANTYSTFSGFPKCVADMTSPTMETTKGMHMNWLIRRAICSGASRTAREGPSGSMRPPRTEQAW